MEQVLTQALPNFWDLHYVLYILGYLFFPRITLIAIWISYDVSLWGLAHPILTLLGWTFMPRLVLGIVALYFLSPENTVFAWLAIILAFLIGVGEGKTIASRG